MCDVEVAADCEGCGTQVDLLENLYKKSEMCASKWDASYEGDRW